MAYSKAPLSVFYDLETTDQNTVGQILNYAFIAVDEDWKVVAECAGDVRISRLQLPRAGAILANRVNVLHHQQQSFETELKAMIRIRDFINEMIAKSGNSVALIGYNSDKFDLRYLRTCFIRNGINPYFSGKVLPKDLLIATRKLAVSRADFPRLPNKNDPNKLSLRLETLTQHFGLLDGDQTHTSIDDVKITIDLARLYAEKFDIDVRTYEGYEAENDMKPGTVVTRLTPGYYLDAESHLEERLYMLLWEDYKNALWIDLESFREGAGRDSIRYRRKSCGELFYEFVSGSSETKSLADRALIELKGITTKNYFSKTLCDVEQDIYQVDFDQIDYLYEAIHNGNDSLVKRSKKKECKVLLTRYKLGSYLESDDDTAFWDSFKKYVLYRYGGQMRLSRNDVEEVEYFPTALELIDEVAEARNQCSLEDKELLLALQQYYLESDVIKVAGDELGVSTLSEGQPSA